MITDTEKLALCLRLREASATIGTLFESLAVEADPIAMLPDADKLADLATEILSALNQLAKPPGAYSFVGAHVDLSSLPVRTAVEDRAANLEMAAQQNGRADAVEARVA